MDGSQPNPKQQLTFPLDPASIQILMQALSVSAGGVISVNTKTGVVTLTTADIADSTNKRYITDAELTVLAATSGTNTGDQTDATLSTSDITTNNVSTSKHGFVPKLPNDATKFFNGVGAFSTPSASATGFATRVLATGSNQNGSGSDTLQTWTTTSIDNNSEFASNVFTAKVAGTYIAMYTNLAGASTLASQWTLSIQKNASSDICRNSMSTVASGGNSGLTVVGMTTLAINDTLAAYINHSSGNGSAVDSGARFVIFQIA